MSNSNILHPHERKILLALKENDGLDVSQLSHKTGLSEASVHRASQWLKIKGLLEYEEERKIKIKPTSEGESYLKDGFPEKKLLKVILKGENEINSLKTKYPNLSIALAWAKKKGWINIDKGKLKATPSGKHALTIEMPIEKALKEGRATGEVLEEIKRRKLAEIQEISHRTFRLTQKGREFASRIGDMKDEIGRLTPEMIKTGAWRKKPFRPYDLNTPIPVTPLAKYHPYTKFINKIRQKLITLGFQEVSGPYVELEFWNSDALFMPQDHPARSIHDVFMIKTEKKGKIKNKMIFERVAETHKNGWITGSCGWGFWNPKQTLNLILRSQTTAVSVRTLANKPEIPGKYFTIGRVFRPDEIDATHFIEFHQCEGIVLGENLTFRHLLGYLKIFGKEIAGAEKVRFRPSYFPFTEPSVELDCFINGKWIEVGGAGIFRPEVTQPLGINVPVLAWGIGFERLSMIKLNVNDIRKLYNDDLEWLRRKAVI